MSEPEIIVEPIKEYPNYITTPNKVLGITLEGFEEIPLIKDLFRIDGVIYFKIDELCYSQDSSVITEIEPADFPEMPEGDFIEFESGNYRVIKEKYNNQDISKVFNGSPNVAYYMIDGACLRGSDLLYSSAIDTGSRAKGVYLWTVNGNPVRVIVDGRVW